MEKKTIEYGTTHKCKVISATKNVISVRADNGEGYILVAHGLKDLPNEGDNGKITFTQNNTLLRGHWQFSAAE